MTFLPHFLNLLSKEAIIARVSYGRPLFARDDRKQLAERIRAEVRGLGQFRSWAGQVEK